MLMGNESITEAIPNEVMRAKYIAAICPLPAPTVFITPISRTCLASIAENDVATRMALSTRAIALKASIMDTTVVICF